MFVWYNRTRGYSIPGGKWSFIIICYFFCFLLKYVNKQKRGTLQVFSLFDVTIYSHNEWSMQLGFLFSDTIFYINALNVLREHLIHCKDLFFMGSLICGQGNSAIQLFVLLLVVCKIYTMCALNGPCYVNCICSIMSDQTWTYESLSLLKSRLELS